VVPRDQTRLCYGMDCYIAIISTDDRALDMVDNSVSVQLPATDKQ